MTISGRDIVPLLIDEAYQFRHVVGADFEVDEANSDEENYVACDGTTEEELRACFPAPAGEDRLRLYTPVLHLEPGTEHLICSRIDIDIEGDLLISRAKGLQMSGGHLLRLCT